MRVIFREATADDLPEVIRLIRQDARNVTISSDDMALFQRSWENMQKNCTNRLFVGVAGDRVVATYQLAVIHGVSLSAARRGQIESVRVDAELRSSGIGAQLMADAEARARDAGCDLMQLTTDSSRLRAHAFYERLGYKPSHLGFKKPLG